MWNVEQLVRFTKSHRQVLISNSENVGVTFGKVTVGFDDLGSLNGRYYKAVNAVAITRAPGKKPKKIQIRLYHDAKGKWVPPELRKKGAAYTGPDKEPQFTLKTDAWVSCSCEYFKYHCEVANAKNENSNVKYSNGADPKITNPRKVAHLCKHLVSALRGGALKFALKK